VKSPIWIAVWVYVLVAIVKKRLALDVPLYTLLQILSVTATDSVGHPVREDALAASLY
jgi:hypothetical protein